MKYFDTAKVLTSLKKIGKGLLVLVAIFFVGMFIGLGIAGQNPLKIFEPSTWQHVLEFVG